MKKVPLGPEPVVGGFGEGHFFVSLVILGERSKKIKECLRGKLTAGEEKRECSQKRKRSELPVDSHRRSRYQSGKADKENAPASPVDMF